MTHRRGNIKLVVLLLVAMIVGGGSTYFIVGRQAQGRSSSRSSKATEKKAEKVDKSDARDDKVDFVEMGAFLVNVTAADRLRYLRTDVSIGVTGMEPRGKKAEGEGKAEAPSLSPADDVRARDAIVRVLSGQSFDRLRTTGPDPTLSKCLQDELAKVVKDCEVSSVLFTSFVMQ
jgi:flagellar basal body-associated protein FliL